MGRKPCCSKGEVNRGAWSFQEDQILINYINTNGQGKWRALTQKSGLNRCGKSCRLRWLNYLRPDIKRGQISKDEEDLIIRLHRLLGNRWSLIAGRLPERTDNEIKNYWNTNLAKRVCHEKPASSSTPKGSKAPENMHMLGNNPHLIRTRAIRCSTLKFPLISQVQGSYDDVNNASPAGLNDDCSIRAMHTQDPKAHSPDNGQCSNNNLNTNTAAISTLEEDDDSLGFLADLDMERIKDIFDDPMNTLSSYVDDHLLRFKGDQGFNMNDPFNSIPAASLPHPGNDIVTSNEEKVDDYHGHGMKCDTRLEMNLMLELKKVAVFLDLEDI